MEIKVINIVIGKVIILDEEEINVNIFVSVFFMIDKYLNMVYNIIVLVK